MNVVRGLHNLSSHFLKQPTAVTIGNFDGLHLGHQQLIQTVTSIAKTRQFLSIAAIFEPQPLEFLKPEVAPLRLTPLHEKIKLFKTTGLDYLLCLYFNKKLATMSARAFIQEVLIERLNIGYLLVGADFQFGCRREGNIDLLQQAAAANHFELAVCPNLMLANQRVSSTAVREALSQQDFDKACALLGRPYSLSGHVKPGAQRGRLLGFPTANILLKHAKLALSGVFAVEIVRESGDKYQGVANLGIRPTIDHNVQPRLEVHLFNFSGNLYGERLEVIFKHKIRDEQRFASLEALKQQIAQDVDEAKLFFKSGQDNG